MRVAGIAVLLILFCFTVAAQRVAVVTSGADAGFSVAFSDSLTLNGVNIVDPEVADSVVRTRNFEYPHNLTAVDAKNLAAAIGCALLVLIHEQTLRRASFSRPDYYEAFAVIYLVSARTGRLVDWRLLTFEAGSEAEASRQLIASAPAAAKDIVGRARTTVHQERSESPSPAIEEVPPDDDPSATGLRPPVPYKRIKPEYTKLAGFYSVRATVDVLVDISPTGDVMRTDVVRWAGFGLDESVTNTIKQMNWRPAMRDGKPLAMRVLLRYNFTKAENDQ